MKESRIEAYAERLVKEGLTHQEIFDEIAVNSGAKLTKIAEVMRKTPSLKKRLKFKLHNTILSLLMVILVSARYLSEVDAVNLIGMIPVSLIFLLIPGILLHGIYYYKRNAHIVTGFYLMLGFIYSISRFFFKLESEFLITGILYAATSSLAFYLNQVLSTDYRYDKQLHQQHPDLREGIMVFDKE